MRGDLAARFTLVRELSGLPETFPKAIRKALATALLAHDPLAETGPLVRARDADKGRAKRAVPILRAHAPMLLGMFGDLLAPPIDLPPTPTFSQPVYNPPPGPDYSRAFWAIPVVLLALLRVCAASSRSTPSYDFSKYNNYKPPTFTDYSSLFPDGGTRSRTSQRALADIYVDMALLHASSNSRTEQLLRKLKREIAADDCDSARGTMAQIQTMASQAPGKLGEDIPMLAAAMRMYCGPGPIGAGPSDAGAGDGGKAKDAGVAKGRAPLKAPAIAPKPTPKPAPPKEDE